MIFWAPNQICNVRHLTASIFLYHFSCCHCLIVSEKSTCQRGRFVVDFATIFIIFLTSNQSCESKNPKTSFIVVGVSFTATAIYPKTQKGLRSRWSVMCSRHHHTSETNQPWQVNIWECANVLFVSRKYDVMTKSTQEHKLVSCSCAIRSVQWRSIVNLIAPKKFP